MINLRELSKVKIGTQDNSGETYFVDLEELEML